MIRPAANNRLVAVDGLRGFAAVWVMLYHYTWWYENGLGGHVERPLCLVTGGGEAVALFFMISGLVMSLTSERSRSAADFAFNRFARLYPPYWAAVAICWFLGWVTALFPERAFDWQDVLINLTMIQSLFGVQDVNGAFWTLFVELQFYAIVTGCVFTGRLFWLLPIMVGLATIDLLAAAGQWREIVPGWWRIDQLLTLLHSAWLFAFGIALHQPAGHRIRWMAAISAIAVGRAIILHDVSTLLWFGVLGGALACAASGWLTMFANPLVAWCGRISYSLYLIHGNLGYIIIRYGAHAGWNVNLAIGVAICSALALAACLTYCIERPSHDALRRWWAARDSARRRVGDTALSAQPTVQP